MVQGIETFNTISQNIGGIDEFTKLMLHFDGSDGYTTFIDSEISAKTVTVAGNTKISTTQSKFNKSSCYFDGTTDYLSIADSDDWDMGTGDYTIDFWIYGSNLAADSVLMGTKYDANGWFLEVYAGKLFFYANSIALISAGLTHNMSNNTWHQIEVARATGVFTFRIDGKSIGSVNYATTITGCTYPLLIGQRTDGLGFTGWLDEIRFSKGICRHFTDYIPPNYPYTL